MALQDLTPCFVGRYGLDENSELHDQLITLPRLVVHQLFRLT